MVINTISGGVSVKDPGVGVPRPLVGFFSLAPQVPSEPAANGAATDFRVSVLTKTDVTFDVAYDHSDFASADPREKRPDLQINVLASEEPGVPPQLLYSAPAPREHAGRTENYIVWLMTAQLQKANGEPWGLS